MTTNQLNPNLVALSRLSHSLTRAAEAAAGALTSSLLSAIQKAQPSIQALAKLLDQAAWEAYKRAGMPYGESQEGLIRWLEGQDGNC